MAGDDGKIGNGANMRRRAALAKLGLGALAVYSAPTVLHIDRSANAIILPTPCHFPGQGKRGPGKCPPGHRKDDGTHRGHRRDATGWDRDWGRTDRSRERETPRRDD